MTKKDRCPKCGHSFETDMEKIVRMTREAPLNFIETLKKQISGLELQQKYAGLLLKAVTDVVKDKKLLNEIIDRHFQLMSESEEG